MRKEGKSVMRWRDGGRDKKSRGKKARSWEEKNDENEKVRGWQWRSERASVKERPTEWDESMWNTKGDRHCHLSDTLFLSLQPLNFIFLQPVSFCTVPQLPSLYPPPDHPSFCSIFPLSGSLYLLLVAHKLKSRFFCLFFPSLFLKSISFLCSCQSVCFTAQGEHKLINTQFNTLVQPHFIFCLAVCFLLWVFIFSSAFLIYISHPQTHKDI